MESCTYCNDIASVREHVIPASYFGFRTYDPSKQWVVPSCETCNLLAGSKMFFSIPEKATYILKRYKSKYRKVLALPYWSQDELSDVSYILRSSIEGSLMAKAILQRKISALEGKTNLARDYMRPEWVYQEYLEYKKRVAAQFEYEKKMKRRYKRT